MQYFDTINAIFKPKNLTTLKSEAKDFIGLSCLWTAVWIIEEGEYQGQWAMTPDYEVNAPFSWVPEEDLELIEEEIKMSREESRRFNDLWYDTWRSGKDPDRLSEDKYDLLLSKGFSCDEIDVKDIYLKERE